MKRCIIKSEVASLLEAAHSREGHWQFRMTLRKLGHVYWSNMTKDTADFIAGCFRFGKHENAQRTHKISPIIVTEPNELWGIDFVGPFPETILTREEVFWCSWPQNHDISQNSSHKDKFFETPLSEGTSRFTYCLIVVAYLSRFLWIIPVIWANLSEVFRCLMWLFGVRRCPIRLYTDPAKYFKGRQLQEFLRLVTLSGSHHQLKLIRQQEWLKSA